MEKVWLLREGSTLELGDLHYLSIRRIRRRSLTLFLILVQLDGSQFLKIVSSLQVGLIFHANHMPKPYQTGLSLSKTEKPLKNSRSKTLFSNRQSTNKMKSSKTFKINKDQFKPKMRPSLVLWNLKMRYLQNKISDLVRTTNQWNFDGTQVKRTIKNSWVIKMSKLINWSGSRMRRAADLMREYSPFKIKWKSLRKVSKKTWQFISCSNRQKLIKFNRSLKIP